MKNLLIMQQKLERDRQNSGIGLSKLDAYWDKIIAWEKQCLSFETMRILLLIQGLQVERSTIYRWLVNQKQLTHKQGNYHG